MANIDTTHIRNIILLSHSGAGKTAISETALHTSGVTSRLGKIEDGNTASDYEPEEQKRNSSIQTSILPCPWKDHKINFIDRLEKLAFASIVFGFTDLSFRSLNKIHSNSFVSIIK